MTTTLSENIYAQHHCGTLQMDRAGVHRGRLRVGGILVDLGYLPQFGRIVIRNLHVKLGGSPLPGLGLLLRFGGRC